MPRSFLLSMLAFVLTLPVSGGVFTFGDKDCLGMNCYGALEPTAGATLQGLAAGAITVAANSFLHPYPFKPDLADFPGTDQIFVGSTQTGIHDGYSQSTNRLPGPLVFHLDYSSAVPAGQTITDLTLGIGADDFQNAAQGQPFRVSVNGAVNAALTNQLNALDQTGPKVQFVSVGISPASLAANKILSISIDDGGDGGDGFAVDFLTIGVGTTSPSAVPEPSSWLLLGSGTILFALAARRHRV